MKSVKTKWVITLSPDIEVLVSQGQLVEADQVLALKDITEEKVVNLTADMAKLMSKREGFFVKKGDILVEAHVFFKKRILCPVEGLVTKVDEYNNVYLRSAEKNKKEIICPTVASVAEVNAESMILEFKAEEFDGEGLSDGRAWGRNGIKEIVNIGDCFLSIRVIVS